MVTDNKELVERWKRYQADDGMDWPPGINKLIEDLFAALERQPVREGGDLRAKAAPMTDEDGEITGYFGSTEQAYFDLDLEGMQFLVRLRAPHPVQGDTDER